MTTREDRIKGVLAGQAVADALGSWAEFGPPGQQPAFRCGVFGHEPGEYTDDTQMAVCVAMGRSDPVKVAGYFLEWFGSRPKDVGGQVAAVLSSVPMSLSDIGAADAMRDAARKAASRPRGPLPGSGNGGLMRTGPVCLAHLGDRERIAQAAREISALTHATEHDQDAAVLWSLAISDAVERGEEWTAADIAGGLDLIPASRRQWWADAIAEALRAHPSRFGPGNGACVTAFKAALSSVAHNTTFEGVIKCAVAIGGDTDTVASIAGGLAGAIHGASAIPAEWRSQVHGWSPDGELDADGLCALALQAAGVPMAG